VTALVAVTFIPLGYVGWAFVTTGPARAAELLGWSAVRDIDRMCADHWRWQSGNPDGYRDA
jgi:UDP-glucose 4-epimerase